MMTTTAAVATAAATTAAAAPQGRSALTRWSTAATTAHYTRTLPQRPVTTSASSGAVDTGSGRAAASSDHTDADTDAAAASTSLSNVHNVLLVPDAYLEAFPAAVRAALSFDTGTRPERNKLRKRAAVQRFRRHATDTGSPEVQVAVLTERVAYLTRHLTEHRKDVSTKRRLEYYVAQRRKLLRYLFDRSPERYSDVIKALGIRLSAVSGSGSDRHRRGSNKHR